MKFRYLPATEQDKQEMLRTIGVESVEELFAEIPESVRYRGKLKLPEPMSEMTLVKHMSRLAEKNASFDHYVSFLGAGVYEHYIPSVVNHVISRSEFYTAYTPYQPEISQGELQAIFEFQTMICELTGMDVANSSMYDGPTALAEAAAMAAGVTRKQKIVISRAVHPEARQILKTSAKGQGYQIVEVPLADGVTDLNQLKELADEETAAVIVMSPNFLGNLENLAEIEKIAHAHKGLLVVSSNPLSLGLLKPPGEYGADIVVGDAQPFGIPASYGGPHCGYLATKKALMRRVPGRIVGQTVDENGTRGFVLTLQAREQHIRRDKATSNICSNQALLALAASVYMSALGKQGIQDVARLNLQKAHYASKRLSEINGIELAFSGHFFNEFVIRLRRPVGEINQELLKKGIIGGFDLGRFYPELDNHMLVAVTEVRTKEEIDQLAESLEGLLS
ncbi:aminomethyl-transferring glycine dehydrogenase subunit GcvPA [Thermoactinomyces sp. CICC 10523]|uniref:aminomethyl-transferring glycine dehydrogenase subunit GcvPA n=1 Tax=Thermoactinomyces sp. CICC 10523 TaxID=2767428 RepID=UPI0018DB9D7A|nr:aminomethyl-transferring glycine dehydrogenase subunit GcvPA [Thermoactinomyces sp. CICC 10523]MBH8596791.1 aminomethyl-transferring glycine dehydrogenase subunit GcvPA [Thermoactinomyces sp. CICC 10523]